MHTNFIQGKASTSHTFILSKHIIRSITASDTNLWHVAYGIPHQCEHTLKEYVRVDTLGISLLFCFCMQSLL